jgi:cytoskeletal protein CcmA (bactofilin family)
MWLHADEQDQDDHPEIKHAMADANQEFPTVLGPDASFKGELSFDKGMRLQGKFEGKINTPGRLHVAKEAKMGAEVEAGSIIVEGEVEGNLSASDRIELKASSRYKGDLTAAKLVVEEGASFVGHVSVGPDSGKNAHKSPNAQRMPQMAPPQPQKQ